MEKDWKIMEKDFLEKPPGKGLEKNPRKRPPPHNGGGAVRPMAWEAALAGCPSGVGMPQTGREDNNNKSKNPKISPKIPNLSPNIIKSCFFAPQKSACGNADPENRALHYK